MDDQVVIVIDPFFDQRNGFFFAVNPAGARSDGQISNNSQEMSRDWDGIWEPGRRKSRDEAGSAEIAIPFKTLRFKPGQTAWGFNVERQIKRRHEIDRWATPRQDIWITNLAEAGRLERPVGIRQGRGLDIRPYVSAARRTATAQFKAGLDVVKNLTPNLNASLTVNTDFAETEVDTRQINLTRFPLFFPEKRAFFLEGAGVFDVAGLGGGGRGPPTSPVLQPHASGCSGASEVPILAGGKVIGRQSDYNIGFLDVQTRRPRRATRLDGAEPARRAREPEPLRQSWVGVIATHGNPPGAGENSLVGVDARFATSNFRGRPEPEP